jgi:oligopeptide transport system permease protein
MENNKEKFTYEDDRHGQKTIEVTNDDFKFVQENSKISDEKLKSKPTTFFKDALKRFSKNKSSVVGGVILGLLVVLAFILPSTISYDVKTPHPDETMLPPKLFNAGTGWWDGTKKYSGLVYDPVNETPAGFEKRAVISISTTKEGDNYTDAVNAYAYGGYVRLWASASNTAALDLNPEFYSYYTSYYVDTYDYEVKFTIGELPSDSFTAQGDYAVFFKYLASDGSNKYVTLKDYSKDTGSFSVNLKEALNKAGVTDTAFSKAVRPVIAFSLKPSSVVSPSVLIQNMTVTKSQSGKVIADEDLAGLSFTDANKALMIKPTLDDGSANKYYWTVINGQDTLYHANILYCDFVYDPYEVLYGEKPNFEFGLSLIQSFIDKGYLSLDINTYVAKSNPTADDLAALKASFKILDDLHCPIRSVDSVEKVKVPGIDPIVNVMGTVSLYRKNGYTSMPIHLMGTNKSGKDMVKLTFDGLKTSLLLGIITSTICFIFGLVWGSISGYFGGWTDILMERFCEILGGLPWIVVMTLCILKLGSSFQTFAIALCLTGWMGTSSITRTQFYRFKDREYIFAARTLGASDNRLIFRHILPNAVGTIITSSVLMIPSVIFSEATISYLGLGLQGLSSLGVTLSENQIYISTNPYLIVFPSVIMALMMISFNLFGNGLRDAFNPSLKGED